jgi:phenylpropionate dioxygenase-like ring-hydroxylating dioxygenase large terminal subunit
VNKPFRPNLPEELSTDAQAEPGAARCPGPSVQEIVARDRFPPPPVLMHERPVYLGSEDVGYERYYSQDIFDREMDRIWQRSWQWVCREEHIPEPGDIYTYEIGYLSYIVVRTQDGAIKGYVNSCLHRGTKLRATEGVSNGRELRCPYHGWTWSLEGDLKRIPCPWDFSHVAAEDYALPEVKVGLWGGFVFINPDPASVPLEAFLGVIPEHFANWDLDQRFVDLHMAKELPCNWKTAQEAFLESYHVMETHPQLMYGVGDANVQYDIYDEHVTRFYAVSGVNSPHLEDPLTDEGLLERMLVGDRSVLGDDLQLTAGETARTVMARYLRKVLSEKYGCDLERFSDSEMIDTIEYHLFPNMVLFPGLSLPMVYRFRPIGLDPNRTLFEILFLRPVPDNGERPEPAEVQHVAEHQSYSTVEGMDASFGIVYDQDTDNLRAQQQGFRASRKRGETLGNYQEARIRHFANTVDKYLAGEL